MSAATTDRIIRGGRVLDVARRLAEPADVLVRDGRIVEIGPPGLDAPVAAETIDASDRLLMPGLVNAHTHGHGALAKGAGDRWTLELLLNSARWTAALPAIEHRYLSTLVGALEMVRKGCTACYDLSLELPLPTVDGFEAVGRAYADAGMRAVVAPMIADRTFFQAIPGLLDALPAGVQSAVAKERMQPGAATVDACRTLLERASFDRARIRLALGPTIPLHCSDEFITANRDLAREHDVGVHMHLAESKIQARVGIQLYGKSLAAHLDDLGFVGPNFTAAHSIWLDPEDIRRLADKGASVAHNPGSNLRLGSGIAPVREMTDANLNVGIGTDSAHCSDNQNMFEAMRFASFVSRVRSHDYETWLTTDTVLHMATEGSARALGFDGELGRLAPGYRADIVLLDLKHIHYLPLGDVVNKLVHTEDGSAVNGVIVDGEIVYWNGQHTGIDIDALHAKVQTAAEDLARLNSEARELSVALEEHVGRFCIGLARQPYHVRSLAGADY